ncbi:3'-5' exonuclease [Treponema pectinovorum]|uniref:3'-5' exonuclease n=1 Tax=Treponema pectinovorum TaxID=164 RepID=UPI0011F2C5C2|nr:3'-5' exonuclease [Treponema pectinovorum]
MTMTERPRLKIINSIKKIKELYDSGRIFCALDTETTGINPEMEHITEIGAVKFSKNGFIESFSTLVNPNVKLSAFITQLTGITDSMLQFAPQIRDVLPNLRDFCKDAIIVAHNAQFDLRFVNAEALRLGFSPLPNEAVDTLILSRTLLPENKTWKQPDLALQFNIETEQNHRALSDAKVCKALFTTLMQMPLPAKKQKLLYSEQKKSGEVSSLAFQALFDFED